MAKRPVEVDAPDPFLEALSRGAEWIVRNKFLVAGALVFCLVVGGALAGWFYHRSTQERKSAVAFAKAIRVYRGLSSQAKEQEIEKALEAFQAVTKEYPGSRWSHFAHLYIGKCYTRLGKTEEAVKEYSLGVKGIESEKYLWPQWLAALAVTQGPDKGIGTLQQGLKGEKPFLEPYLRYNLALLYQEKGDLDKAAQILEEINGKFPSSPFGEEARRLLEVLK